LRAHEWGIAESNEIPMFVVCIAPLEGRKFSVQAGRQLQTREREANLGIRGSKLKSEAGALAD
jgi:hypothetical protein